MAITPTDHESPSKIIPADPDLFDEIQFKPINKGLGFHHEAKKASVPTYSNASRIKRPLEKTDRPMHASRPSFPTETQLPSFQHRQDSLPTVAKADLGSMYGTVAGPFVAPSPENMKSAPVAPKEVVAAARWKQMMAWAVDVTLILVGQWLTLSGLFFAAGLGWTKVIGAIGPQDTIVMTGLLFCFTYMLYFTVLDLGSTPGKSLFKVNVLRPDGKRPTAWNTALRALISLLSIPLLGLPLLMDFQGKLSETTLAEE